MEDIDKAMEWIIRAEGGLVDHPADPGGVTKYGISQRAYPNVDIRSLTEEGAIAIYRRDYWDAVKGDRIPWPMNLAVFDCAVNCGHRTAVRLLQKALRIEADGVLGIKTMAAIERFGRTMVVFEDYLWERADYYCNLKRQQRAFLAGWINRLCELRRFVLDG